LVGKTTEPHLGLPNNLTEWADLLIEGSLLPKPGQLARQQMGNPNTKSNVSGLGNSNNSINSLKKTQFFISTLAREPQQKWNEIHWRESVDQALSDAKTCGKPIFIEMVVGRLGEKTSKVC